VTRSRRLFGTHFALYYRILYRIATKVRNLQNPIEDYKETIHGIAYAAYSFIFKSFRLLAGVSPTMQQHRAMERGSHSSRALEVEPTREVRELTPFDGEALQFWLNYFIIHLDSFHGMSNVVCKPGGSLRRERHISNA
jgi:hypothetical protein